MFEGGIQNPIPVGNPDDPRSPNDVEKKELYVKLIDQILNNPETLLDEKYEVYSAIFENYSSTEFGYELDGLETVKNNNKVVAVGDLHARIGNLNNELSKKTESGKSVFEKVIAGDVSIAFVGDYFQSELDMGKFQNKYPNQNDIPDEEFEKFFNKDLNSIALVMLLKMACPNNAFIVTGNHDNDLFKGHLGKGNYFIDERLGRFIEKKKISRGLISRYKEAVEKLPLMSIIERENDSLVISHTLPVDQGKAVENVIDLGPDIPKPLLQDIGKKLAETFNLENIKNKLMKIDLTEKNIPVYEGDTASICKEWAFAILRKIVQKGKAIWVFGHTKHQSDKPVITYAEEEDGKNSLIVLCSESELPVAYL